MNEINEVKWLYVELKGISYSLTSHFFKLKYTEDSEPTLVHTYDTLIITDDPEYSFITYTHVLMGNDTLTSYDMYHTGNSFHRTISY